MKTEKEFTAKQLRQRAVIWEKREKEWETKLAANPHDEMTQIAAKTITKLSRSAAARLRMRASTLIGKKI